MSLILEGTLVDAVDGVRPGQVRVEGDRIAAVGDGLGRPHFAYGRDHLIFPAFGDVHVHLRYGEEHKEDFRSGTAAALHGGVAFMVDMPNNPLPPVDARGLEVKRQAAASLPVDLDFYAGVGPRTRPFDHPFYKVYLAPGVGPLSFESRSELEETLAHYRGCRVTFHCEDPEILTASRQAPNHEERRPPEAEVKAVETVLEMARSHGMRVHLAHLSTAAALDRVRRARSGEEGPASVLCEVTPHHLYFDTENRRRALRAEFLKMNPPLRSPEDRQALLRAFRRGEIDFLATDHAPHTVAEKASENPSGVPHLDTYGGFVCWLLHRNFSPRRLARHCCYLPGLFMGRKVGRIAPGYRAHLAVLAVDQPWTVRTEDLRTRCGWSPFEGETLPGRVTLTVASGRLFRRGEEIT